LHFDGDLLASDLGLDALQPLDEFQFALDGGGAVAARDAGTVNVR
jgi:hypothetical protein